MWSSLDNHSIVWLHASSSAAYPVGSQGGGVFKHPLNFPLHGVVLCNSGCSQANCRYTRSIIPSCPLAKGNLTGMHVLVWTTRGRKVYFELLKQNGAYFIVQTFIRSIHGEGLVSIIIRLWFDKFTGASPSMCSYHCSCNYHMPTVEGVKTLAKGICFLVILDLSIPLHCTDSSSNYHLIAATGFGISKNCCLSAIKSCYHHYTYYTHDIERDGASLQSTRIHKNNGRCFQEHTHIDSKWHYFQYFGVPGLPKH